MRIVYSHMVKLKFLPPTATKGSRYKATWKDFNSNTNKASVTWNREYDLEHIDYMQKAVNAFCDWCNRNVFIREWTVHSVMAAGQDEDTDILLIRLQPLQED